MHLETERLVLRPWKEEDAYDLFTFASDPRIGFAAGWPPHQSVSESIQVLHQILMVPETWAIMLKETGQAIGSISLMIGTESHMDLPENEAEIGYWIGSPFWGKGLMPEAAEELIRHGFEDLRLEKIWAGYFEGNEKSRRVQEKCGLSSAGVRENVHNRGTGQDVREFVTCLKRLDWKAGRL